MTKKIPKSKGYMSEGVWHDDTEAPYDEFDDDDCMYDDPEDC